MSHSHMLLSEKAPGLTRLAPTPSGFLHVGNLLSFSATIVLAEHFNAGVLLRIDDLDNERVRPEYLDDVFLTLEFMQIPWSHGPRNTADYSASWSQLLRMEHYHRLLDALIQTGRVFACNCSRSRLTNGVYDGTCRHKNIPLNQPGVAWRLRTEPDALITMRSLGKTVPPLPLPPSMYDFVIRKKNGDPAYQLASVADDLLYGADLVVRGEDLLPSTLGQLYLASLLPGNPFSDTLFWHHPLVMGPSGQKLSKSAGDTSIQHMRASGLTPAAICTAAGKMMDPAAAPQDIYALGRLMLEREGVIT